VGSYDFKTFRESDEHPTVDFSCLSPEDIIAAQKKSRYNKLLICW